jgi:hypothetical protein
VLSTLHWAQYAGSATCNQTETFCVFTDQRQDQAELRETQTFCEGKTVWLLKCFMSIAELLHFLFCFCFVSLVWTQPNTDSQQNTLTQPNTDSQQNYMDTA